VRLLFFFLLYDAPETKTGTFRNLNDDVKKKSPKIQVKPDFVFFGESISQEVKDRRYVAQQELFDTFRPS